MYRTTIEAVGGACLYAIREHTHNPETSPWEVKDHAALPTEHGARILACAKLTMLRVPNGMRFLSEEK